MLRKLWLCPLCMYCRSTYCFLSSRYQSTILCFNTFLPLSQSCGLCLIPFFSLECLFLYSGPPREEGQNGQDRDLLSIGGGQASNLVSFFFFFYGSVGLSYLVDRVSEKRERGSSRHVCIESRVNSTKGLLLLSFPSE